MQDSAAPSLTTYTLICHKCTAHGHHFAFPLPLPWLRALLQRVLQFQQRLEHFLQRVSNATTPITFFPPAASTNLHHNLQLPLNNSMSAAVDRRCSQLNSSAGSSGQHVTAVASVTAPAPRLCDCRCLCHSLSICDCFCLRVGQGIGGGQRPSARRWPRALGLRRLDHARPVEATKSGRTSWDTPLAGASSRL